MPKKTSTAGSELFIVDNSEQEWKVLKYLSQWCDISSKFDIATAYFEVGALLALDEEWQKVGKIRVLMGDEVSRRTKKAFEEGVNIISRKLNDSIEFEKEKNDFLAGVPAIVDALKSGKIECRVYRKEKFHAKAYITHAKLEVVGSMGLVGSSNFTYPGITDNIELNVQISGTPVSVLQEWYEKHWEEAEDVSPQILNVMEPHIKEYRPFEVYVKSLYEFFRGHEQTADEWERNFSKVFPILAKYQRDGYHHLIKIASRHQGAFLCDGVGLGKTYIGLMLIERLVVHEHKRVALFVPKAAREPVWESTLNMRLPEIFEGFYSFKIFNHTDLLREKLAKQMDQVRLQADVIIIDEAHHFRNTGIRGEEEGERQSRYWKMYDLCEGKQVYMLTATPVNNRLTDIQHMIELFSRHKTDYFKDAPLGVHSLQGHIIGIEKKLDKLSAADGSIEATEFSAYETDDLLSSDALFQALVVQRSRAYVKRSMAQEDNGTVMFPEPRKPQVVPYSVKQTYGKILKMLEDAFSKQDPLFTLAMYYPYAYLKKTNAEIDPFTEGRQKQVVRLIRIGFLKRFESSIESFTMSCWRLMKKLLAWTEVHAEQPQERKLLDRWKKQHEELLRKVHAHENDLVDNGDEDYDEDIIAPEMLEAVEKLSRDEFDIQQIINETLLDLNQIAEFLRELSQFKPSQDKKLRELIKLLKTDKTLKSHKVIIFSEFMDTARYLKKQLVAEGITGVAEIDSGYSGNRADLIRRFSPYYNGSSSAELKKKGEDEIRVLIATDVLSEGLNLQDATQLINYDLHWNPVRLMQRIGRVDRRLDPEIEARIIADHPDRGETRGKIAYWNFLPPDELDELIRLYSIVSHKTLRISKTFGIEGRKLLKPDDDYDDLRNFLEEYEGKISPVEDMRLELDRLLKEDPGLEERINRFPGRIFSGKENLSPGALAVFFCYSRPARDEEASRAANDDIWTLEAGDTQWYLYDTVKETITEDPIKIIEFIRSAPETPRRCTMEKKTLKEIRTKLDAHVKNTYLKKVNAPVGVKPTIKTWMELN